MKLLLFHIVSANKRRIRNPKHPINRILQVQQICCCLKKDWIDISEKKFFMTRLQIPKRKFHSEKFLVALNIYY